MTPSAVELNTATPTPVFYARSNIRVSCICTHDAIWEVYQGDQVVGVLTSSASGELGGVFLPSLVVFDLWPGAELRAKTNTAGNVFATVTPVVYTCGGGPDGC